MKDPTKRVEFVKSGRGKAQEPPDPRYPNGIFIPGDPKIKNCKIELPYPAPECGYWLVKCNDCHALVMITAAGRIDDPIGFNMPCKRKEEKDG